MIQKCAPHERGPCAPKFEERSHEETLHQEGCARRAAWALAKICTSSRIRTKLRFTPFEARVVPVPTSKKTRGARIRGRFRSVNAHDEQKNKLRWIGHFAKVQEHHCGAYSQWRSANPRGGTSVRSRSESVHNCATTRGNAGSLITGKTLRRSRILVRVGQRSKTTVHQRREDNYVQNGQFRTSCRSRVVRQFWTLFVLYIAATAGLSHSRKLERITFQNPKQKQKEGWQSRFGRPFARSSWVVGGVHK